MDKKEHEKLKLEFLDLLTECQRLDEAIENYLEDADRFALNGDSIASEVARDNAHWCWGYRRALLEHANEIEQQLNN